MEHPYMPFGVHGGKDWLDWNNQILLPELMKGYAICSIKTIYNSPIVHHTCHKIQMML